MRRSWFRKAVASMATVAIAISNLGVGSLKYGGVFAADTALDIINADFSNEIWGDDAGWSVTSSDWGTDNNVTIKTVDSSVNYYYGNENGGTMTLKQSVSLTAGDYVFTVIAQGKDSDVYISLGSDSSDKNALSGWGTDDSITFEYSAESDISSIDLAILADVTSGGWGYIKSISYTYEAPADEEPANEDPVVEDSYTLSLSAETEGDTSSITATLKNGDTVLTEIPDGYSISYWTSDESAITNNGLTATYTSSESKTITVSCNLFEENEPWGPLIEENATVEITIDTTDSNVDPSDTDTDDVTYSLALTIEEADTYYVDTAYTVNVVVTDSNGKIYTQSELDELGYQVSTWSNDESDTWTNIFTNKKTIEDTITASSVGTYTLYAQLYDTNNNWAPITNEVSAQITFIETSNEDAEVSDINVARVPNLTNDFLMGVDISSVISEFDSGVVYYDYDGNAITDVTTFVKFLKSNGVNAVRVRVWNNPYDASGNGFGGGNNDVAKAKTIADACEAAGVEVLVDFHCSDFWTDPGKQFVPAAWSGYTLEQKEEALYNYIYNSLNTIDPNKNTVTMVQVGNETTSGFVGETSVANMCTLFSSGSSAVRAYNEDVKVVIHVTNPEKGTVTTWANNLAGNSVDYDVLATSYYPYWHGTLANLTSQLSSVRETYGVQVMVAETSYAYSLVDSDGHANTTRAGNNDSGFSEIQPFTVQGQANSVRNVVNAVVEAGGIGVFYWEPAWITVGDIRGLSGDELSAQIASNSALWEANGSGWASSYAAIYDPNDAGKWYGGSAVDNEAMFYSDGTPTESLKVWRLLMSGAVDATTRVDEINDTEIIIEAGEELVLPETIVVGYNSGNEDEAVTWNLADISKVNTESAGTYRVNGTVTFSKEITAGDYRGAASADVTLTVKVNPYNLITDRAAASFEIASADGYYTTDGTGVDLPASDDPYKGSKSAHWWSTSATETTITYVKETFMLSEGAYTFECIAQGLDGDTVTVFVTDTDGNIIAEGDAAVLENWKNWKTPSVEFTLDSETEVVLNIKIGIQDGGWGTIDCLYLYAQGEKIIDLNIAEDVPEIDIDEATLEALFTAEDLELIENGFDVAYTVVIENIADSLDAADQAVIDSLKSSGYTFSDIIIGISLLRQVGEEEPIEVTEISNSIKFTLTLPDSLSDVDPDAIYYAIDIHNGASIIVPAALDGTEGTITFELNKFSPVAIAYKVDTAEEPAEQPVNTRPAAEETTPAEPSVTSEATPAPTATPVPVKSGDTEATATPTPTTAAATVSTGESIGSTLYIALVVLTASALFFTAAIYVGRKED